MGRKTGRVAVTGGSGRLGAYVVRTFHETAAGAEASATTTIRRKSTSIGATCRMNPLSPGHAVREYSYRPVALRVGENLSLRHGP